MKRRSRLILIAATGVLVAAGLFWNSRRPVPGGAGDAEPGGGAAAMPLSRDEVPPEVLAAGEEISRRKRDEARLDSAARASRAGTLEELAAESEARGLGGEERARYLGVGLASVGRRDFGEVVRFLEERPWPSHDAVRDRFLAEWEYGIFDAPGTGPSRLLENFRDLAGTDPAAAAAVVEEFPDGDLRNVLAFEAAESWGRADLEAARAWFDGFPEASPARAWIAEALAEALAESSPSSAAAWAADLDDPGARLAALAASLSRWTAKEPAEALEWFRASVPPDDAAFPDLAPAVAGAWAPSDPAAALSWVAGLSPGAVREEAAFAAALEGSTSRPRETLDLLREIAGSDSALAGIAPELGFHAAASWAEEDPVGAAGYLRELGDSAFRTRAVVGMLMTLAYEEPEASLEWALDLPGGSDRDEAMAAVLERWAERSGREGALREIESHAAAIEGEGRAVEARRVRNLASDLFFPGER